MSFPKLATLARQFIFLEIGRNNWSRTKMAERQTVSIQGCVH
jgi:hypothetical protein